VVQLLLDIDFFLVKDYVTDFAIIITIPSTFGVTVEDVDLLQLEVRVSVVNSGFVDSMFVRDSFPELGSDPVAAFADLKMDDLAHVLASKFDEFSMNFDEFSMNFDEFR
jgi:hypothetical protein